VISSNHLDPGTTGQIKATVDTTGKAGHIEKHIVVYSNDRIMPAFTLSFSMEVVQK
jgi:hypothetical protein